MNGALPTATGQWPLKAATVIFALGTAVLAGLASVSLGGGQRLLPLVQAYDQAAEKAATPALSRSLSQSALAIRPVDVAAWVRLARTTSASPGNSQLNPAALLALDHSYAVGPYASQVLDGRIGFAYDHWRALSPDLQAQAISEVKAAWPVAPQHERLLATAGRIHDSAGALALSGLLLTLKLQGDADIAAAQRLHRAAPNP